MGLQNSKITIITAYRPVRGTGDGLLIVTYQHRKFLGQSVVPRKQMLSDLQEFITPLLQEDHHIVLGIDANKNIPLVHVEALRYYVLNGLL